MRKCFVNCKVLGPGSGMWTHVGNRKWCRVEAEMRKKFFKGNEAPPCSLSLHPAPTGVRCVKSRPLPVQPSPWAAAFLRQQASLSLPQQTLRHEALCSAVFSLKTLLWETKWLSFRQLQFFAALFFKGGSGLDTRKGGSGRSRKKCFRAESFQRFDFRFCRETRLKSQIKWILPSE